MALNAERGWTATLNAEWKTNHGSERQNWETMEALNAKNWRNGSERQTKKLTLNTKLENNSSGSQTKKN